MEPRESDLDPRQIDMEIDRGERPDRALTITRRTFINKAILAGTAAGAASVGWFPTINTIDLAFGQQVGAPHRLRSYSSRRRSGRCRRSRL